jgi:hypothetical protein
MAAEELRPGAGGDVNIIESQEQSIPRAARRILNPADRADE